MAYKSKVHQELTNALAELNHPETTANKEVKLLQAGLHQSTSQIHEMKLQLQLLRTQMQAASTPRAISSGKIAGKVLRNKSDKALAKKQRLDELEAKFKQLEKEVQALAQRLGLVLQSRQNMVQLGKENPLLVKDLEIDKSRIEAKELEKENLRLALELEKENRRLAKELERENRKLSKELERDKLRPPTRKLDKTNLKLENEPETTTTSKKNNGYNQVDTEVHQELKNFGIVPTACGISDSTYSCARAVLEKQRAYRSSNSLRRKSTYNAAIQCSFGKSNDLMDHASEEAEENEFQSQYSSASSHKSSDNLSFQDELQVSRNLSCDEKVRRRINLTPTRIPTPQQTY
ncbi:unnamed protein product [Sphagnum troendelagicum]|uniref:Lebercilin domain-containing protein n=1 Tax=Sphagnum troendelagicum TaxID=128251 RepID=A0ABP0U9B7_9BRYO